MGHEPGPFWEEKRKQPMIKIWACLQCTAIILGIAMLITGQSKIKGGYLMYRNDKSLPPIGDISSSTQVYLDWTRSPYVDISTVSAG